MFTNPVVLLQLLETKPSKFFVQTTLANSELTYFYPSVAEKNQLLHTKGKNMEMSVKHQSVSWTSIDKKSISTNYRKKSLRTDLFLK